MTNDLKKKKIVHVKILDGNTEDIVNMRKMLSFISKKNEYEFILSNDQIEMRDIGELIKELYDLLQAYKGLKNKKEDK